MTYLDANTAYARRTLRRERALDNLQTVAVWVVLFGVVLWWGRRR